MQTNRLTALCSLVVLLVAAHERPLAAQPQQRVPQPRVQPNVILIMADDLGYGDLGCYGGTLPTPHIDQLAEDGLRLTDFHSSGHVCSPTRAGLLTGRYQRRANVPGVIYANPENPSHSTGLSPQEATFARLLRASGYTTGLMGKWHLGYSRKFNPVHHGFQEFQGYVSGNVDYQSHRDGMQRFDWWDGLRLRQRQGYVTHLITEDAVDFIRRHRERPFCLYVAHEAVHFPWQGPGDPPQRGPGAVPADKAAKPRAFREMLRELDHSVGAIRAALEQHNLADRTLVWFFSDNGPDGGSAGPLRGRKGTHWEGGHRVPSIAWWPGEIPPGSVQNQLSITLDVMPTILDLCHIPPPERPLDGKSLAERLRNPSLPAASRQLFWNGRAMRDGPWKLILRGQGGPEVGLYQLEHDLGERHNVRDAHPARVAAMQQAMQLWYDDVTGSP